MLKKIDIKNFRTIKNLKLGSFKKFNLFIGNNESGKTSILDAIYTSLNPNNPHLLPKTNSFRKIEKINSLYFKLFFYKLNIEKNIEINSSINNKTISTKISPKFIQTDYNVNNTGSGTNKEISGLNLDFGTANNKKSYSHHSEVSLDKNNLQNPFPVKNDPNFYPTISGDYLNPTTLKDKNNATNHLENIISNKQKNKVIEFLKEYKSSIYDIYIDSIGSIKVLDEEFPEGVPLNLYGDGLIKGLNIYLSSLSGYDVILYDEIENGLHWSHQKSVFNNMYNITKNNNTQYFLTTHSRDVVISLYETAQELDFLNELNIVRLDRSKEKIEVETIDKETLQYYLNNKFEIR